MSDDLTFAVAQISDARARMNGWVIETPVWRWAGPGINDLVAPGTRVHMKLELFQRAGSFKPRGALTTIFAHEAEARARGVVAASAGNHAIAVSYAANVLGVTAKVVMPRTASVARVEACRRFGADVEQVVDIAQVFARARAIEADERRVFVHPFEGPHIALGTATLGLELARQIPDLDAVIIPVGGGGLAGGMAAALDLVAPACQVFGVEPIGADAILRSFRAGAPRGIEKVTTIADSLGAPVAEPYSLALCRRHLDDLVLVDDDALRAAMRLLFRELKLAVEPAAAAATAALLGPLRDRLAGKSVAVVVCGSNIDSATWFRHVAA